MEYGMEYWISNISNVISNCLGLVSLASQSVYIQSLHLSRHLASYLRQVCHMAL